MRVGILTHPLGQNYGGLLQAYSLQRILMLMGHDAWIIRREMETPVWKKCKRKIKKIIYFFTIDKIKTDASLIDNFILKIAPKTEKLKTTRQLRKFFERNRFDAIIVGSDQVWRPRYINPIENFFLDFVDDPYVKKISYAASFGVDSWEFTPWQTERCRKLISKFNAVSVREISGVSLCKEHFGIAAYQVLDPTMLCPVEFFEKLIGKTKDSRLKKSVFAYVFDQSETYLDLISEASFRGDIQTFNQDIKNGTNLLHSVESWLQHIRCSRLVITDSFHVCVFSILFNTPFLVIGNSLRGNARINDLLRLFNLSDRLVVGKVKDIERPINWSAVNAQLEALRKNSISFLTNALER